MISVVSASSLNQATLAFCIVLLQVRFGAVFINNSVLGYL